MVGRKFMEKKMFGFKHFMFELTLNLKGRKWKCLSSIEKCHLGQRMWSVCDCLQKRYIKKRGLSSELSLYFPCKDKLLVLWGHHSFIGLSVVGPDSTVCNTCSGECEH